MALYTTHRCWRTKTGCKIKWHLHAERSLPPSLVPDTQRSPWGDTFHLHPPAQANRRGKRCALLCIMSHWCLINITPVQMQTNVHICGCKSTMHHHFLSRGIILFFGWSLLTALWTPSFIPLLHFFKLLFWPFLKQVIVCFKMYRILTHKHLHSCYK